jgi:sialidase-1
MVHGCSSTSVPPDDVNIQDVISDVGADTADAVDMPDVMDTTNGDDGSVAGPVVFVESGNPVDVRVDGQSWTQSDGALVNGGCYNFLHAGQQIGHGDFSIYMKLSVSTPEGARFIFQGNNYLLFSDSSGNMLFEGPAFTEDEVDAGPTVVAADQPFVFEVTRVGNELSFLIDKNLIYTQLYLPETFGTFGLTPALGIGELGLCPSESEMRVIDFRAEGDLSPLPSAAPSVDVYSQGQDGYHTFRIPAIVRTVDGTLLAFAEGRKNGTGDSGDVDVVLKRSTDNGDTWQAIQVVADFGADTVGNPVPVVDRTTGFIWLALTSNKGDLSLGDISGSVGNRNAWILHSEDDGQTWSQPTDINATARGADWRWMATGPGHGIQLEDGRMVIPCDHSTGSSSAEWFSHVMVSDDHGLTWNIAGSVPGGNGDEATVAERLDGSLLLNFRSKYGKSRRAFAISTDRGQTWSEAALDAALIEPVCEGSILRLDADAWNADAAGNTVLAFSNPASIRREVMGIHVSYDGGATWPTFNWVHPGPAGYSDIVELTDGSIGLLYEKGWLWYSETITFSGHLPKWIMGDLN